MRPSTSAGRKDEGAQKKREKKEGLIQWATVERPHPRAIRGDADLTERVHTLVYSNNVARSSGAGGRRADHYLASRRVCVDSVRAVRAGGDPPATFFRPTMLGSARGEGGLDSRRTR